MPTKTELSISGSPWPLLVDGDSLEGWTAVAVPAFLDIWLSEVSASTVRHH